MVKSWKPFFIDKNKIKIPISFEFAIKIFTVHTMHFIILSSVHDFYCLFLSQISVIVLVEIQVTRQSLLYRMSFFFVNCLFFAFPILSETLEHPFFRNMYIVSLNRFNC